MKKLSPAFVHWAWNIRREFIAEIESFADCLRRRFLPTFDSITEEADKVDEDAYGRLSERASEDADPYDLVESAFEVSLDYFMRIEGLKQGVINLFTAGLYHAFLQQLLMFHRYALVQWEHRNDQSLQKLDVVTAELGKLDIELAALPGWTLIDGELRHIANVVKHADGSSCEVLRTARPDLFVKPALRDEPPIPGRREVHQPLIGEGLYITIEQFEVYFQAVLHFWLGLADLLDERTRISN